MQTIIQVSAAELKDVNLLAQWAQAMAMETESKYLDEATVSAGVKAGILDARRAQYFIAYIDGEAAGTLMLTTEWSDWRNGFWWWIQSVYVSPTHRRKGVYRALYDHVYAIASEDQTVCGIRLYVEYENSVAQKTYESLGMRDARYRVMEVSAKNT